MATQELTNLSIKNSPKVGTVMGKNARGGIDRLSKRELRGERPQGSTGVKGTSSYQELPAIPATSLSPVAPMQLPPAPVPQDPGDVIGSNNVGLATGSDGALQLDGSKLVANKTSNDPVLFNGQAPADNLGGIFSQYLAQMEAPASTADIYAQEAAQADLEGKRKAFTNLSSNLNSITANRDAAILKLEGENMDRGVTKGIYAGQASRINREAAIQALPVQAQLAAAQGNLEMAEAHVDKMFAIKSQDAQAQYQFKGKVLDAVYQFATDQEKRRLDDVKAKEDRTYAEQQDFLKTQRSLLSSALQQGAPSSVVNAINGATTQEEALIAAGQYNGDVLARQIKQKQLADMYAPAESSAAAPKVVSINGVDSIWNPQTGQFEAVSVGGAGATDPTNLEAKYTSLLNDIGVATSLLDQVGAGGAERFVKNIISGNNKPAQLQTITDTIKANLLTMNTDPAIKKFFGPQMSNRDTELMTGAATTLNPVTQTPEEYQKDLQDAASLIARARQAVQQGSGATNMSSLPSNIVMSPDGIEIQIID